MLSSIPVSGAMYTKREKIEANKKMKELTELIYKLLFNLV